MKAILVILMLIASEALGLVVAQCYYQLFLKAVPPLAMSGFNAGATRAVFMGYGLVVGLGMFVWAAVVAGIAWLAGRRRGAKTSSLTPPPAGAPDPPRS